MTKSILLLSILMLLPHAVCAGMVGNSEPNDTLSTLAELVNILSENYIDSVDIKELQEAAIEGALSTLDPHSVYISPQELRERGKSSSNKLYGVGLDVTLRNGILTVLSSIEGMSGHKQGMRSGDQIRLINGKSLQGETLHQLVTCLRGGLGTEVVLTVQSRGTTRWKEIVLVREQLPDGAIYSKILPPGILYIRIYFFTSQTTREVRRIVNQAMKQDVLGIVLDLRSNPGGPLVQAAHVTDVFLNRGTIVSVQGTNKMNRAFIAHSGGRGGEVPMVVLVNGSTASSAEIVTAALQEQKRAIVVGTKTFGKGTVQNIFRLNNGAAIQITTGKYYTPSGRSLQGTGVMPDIVVKSKLTKVKTSNSKENSIEDDLEDLQLQTARSILISLYRTEQGDDSEDKDPSKLRKGNDILF